MDQWVLVPDVLLAWGIKILVQLLTVMKTGLPDENGVSTPWGTVRFPV